MFIVFSIANDSSERVLVRKENIVRVESEYGGIYAKVFVQDPGGATIEYETFEDFDTIVNLIIKEGT